MPDPLLADALESFVGCMKGVAPEILRFELKTLDEPIQAVIAFV